MISRIAGRYSTHSNTLSYKHNAQRDPPYTDGLGERGRTINNVPLNNIFNFFHLLHFYYTDLCLVFFENKSMKVANVVLSRYERSILEGAKGSKADILTATKRTQAIVNAMLNAKSEPIELEDGTTVTPTIDEMLIAGALQKEIENPKGLETIEKLMKIRGELDDKATEVNVSLVDQDLAKRAIG